MALVWSARRLPVGPQRRVRLVPVLAHCRARASSFSAVSLGKTGRFCLQPLPGGCRHRPERQARFRGRECRIQCFQRFAPGVGLAIQAAGRCFGLGQPPANCAAGALPALLRPAWSVTCPTAVQRGLMICGLCGCGFRRAVSLQQGVATASGGICAESVPSVRPGSAASYEMPGKTASSVQGGASAGEGGVFSASASWVSGSAAEQLPEDLAPSSVVALSRRGELSRAIMAIWENWL